MPLPQHAPLPKLCLASQSPRRRQILENLGLPFFLSLPSAEEETPDAQGLAEGTESNAWIKAKAVAASLGKSTDTIVIGADTLVAVDGEVLGKPGSPEEAKTMLRKLSGREHEVVTGVALFSTSGGALRKSHDISRVKFRPLSEDEIAEYVVTKEPHDKAGSYAVQGLAALFIERIEGSYTNVMGLPVEKLLMELSALTGRRASEWFR